MRTAAAALACLVLLAAVAEPALGRVIHVGRDGDVQKISEAARIAQDGDVVEIATGEWHGDVAIWWQKRLTIRGVGERPVLIADGKSAEDKAIWVIRDGDFVVDNIEFRGARVADANGAGIRFEAGRLRVVNCVFRDNEMGLQTSHNAEAQLRIENSVFAEAARLENSLSHLLYVGRIASLEIVGSRFHGGYRGHLIKSRARSSDIRYSLIIDGPRGEASYEVDFPNGGVAILVGNVIAQSAQSRNPVVVAYGAEGALWPENRLYLSHNTLLSAGWKPAWFVRAWREGFPEGMQAVITDNLMSGFGVLSFGLAGVRKNNYFVPSWVFGAPELLDFTLSQRSWLRGLASSGTDSAAHLGPKAEFALPAGTTPQREIESWAPGAFQSPSRD